MAGHDDNLAKAHTYLGRFHAGTTGHFISGAFEYQWWDADGGVAIVQSTATANEHSAFASALAGPDIEVSMVGFSLGGGLTW